MGSSAVSLPTILLAVATSVAAILLLLLTSSFDTWIYVKWDKSTLKTNLAAINFQSNLTENSGDLYFIVYPVNGSASDYVFKTTISTKESVWRFSSTAPGFPSLRYAQVCLITAFISVIAAVGVGSFALSRQQVISGVMTGVCFCCAAIWMTLATVMITYRAFAGYQKAAFYPKRLRDAIAPGFSCTLGPAFYMCIVSAVACYSAMAVWTFYATRVRRMILKYGGDVTFDQVCSTL